MRNPKLLLLTGLLGGLGLRPARAQQVLLQADVAEDTLTTSIGPNRRYFGHFYAGYGFVLGPAGGAGAAVKYGFPSTEFQLGGRLKRRCSQALALTLDLRYDYLRYELAQESGKVLPSPALHQSEMLGLHQAQLEGGLRCNVGRRGNVLGNYLDLLAWGGLLAGSSHTTEDEPGPGVGSVEVTERNLAYLARWSGGVGLRLGHGHLALVGRYRLSPSFRDAGAAWPELPRGVLGLEIALF